MKLQETLGNVLATMAVVCAITTTGLLVRRELRSGPRVSREPIRVEHFNYTVGHRIGPSNARVSVVEFSDFQCPFCKMFEDSIWPAITKRFPHDVALVYRHFPIPTHKNAYPAARASECAAAQGKFAAFHDILFKKQDSLGTKAYSEFAVEAGVPDLPAFNKCNEMAAKVPDVERDISVAQALGLHATPTIMVNDKRFPSAPTTDELVALIEKELRNRPQ